MTKKKEFFIRVFRDEIACFYVIYVLLFNSPSVALKVVYSLDILRRTCYLYFPIVFSSIISNFFLLRKSIFKMFKVNNVSVFVNIYSTHLRNRKYVFKGNAMKCVMKKVGCVEMLY